MSPSKMESKKILFNISGSIAAFKACEIVSQLVKSGHEVQVVCTPSTFEFVGRATLEGLSGRKVISDMYESGQVMDHIRLARWADFGVLCPASANTIAKMAHGMADDIVSALFLAWEKHKPYFIAPAMNVEMFEKEITQQNLRSLSGFGATVLPTAVGTLACGEVGAGRLLEPEQILAALMRKPTARDKGELLITFGGTREAIDSVRYLTNLSTGSTGATLSDLMAQRGWAVTCLRAEGSASPRLKHSEHMFSDFSSLNRSLKQILDQKTYAAIIHLAAVSDFSVEKSEGKISSQQELNLKLKPNFKIVSHLRDYAKPRSIRVIAFKLTDTSLELEQTQAVQNLLADQVDMVVHNDVKDLGANRKMTIFQKTGERFAVQGVTELANSFDRYLTGEKI